ncbi:hypothetical protein D3C81_1721070 [compost metagenome]
MQVNEQLVDRGSYGGSYLNNLSVSQLYRLKISFDDIFDVNKIACLLPIAKDVERQIFFKPVHKNRNYSTLPFRSLSWAVNIGIS